MSKRTKRRAAEREARKIAYQQLRQSRRQTDSAASETAEPTAGDLLKRAHAFFQTTPDPATVHVQTAGSTSEAQLAANRANAQLSTGPVTSEGRAKSSMNALKNGLTGKTVLLPHEDAAQYRQALQAAIETCQPATDDELALVQSLVDCNWRLDRIQRLESAVLLKGHIEFANKYEDRTAAERALLIDADAYLKYEKQLRNLNIQEARLRRIMDKARAELSRLQAIRKREEKQTPQARPQPQTQNGFEFSTHAPLPQSGTSPHARAARNA